MSGVAGRSGRKAFVPDPEQRNIVRTSTGWGIPQQHICRLVFTGTQHGDRANALFAFYADKAHELEEAGQCFMAAIALAFGIETAILTYLLVEFGEENGGELQIPDDDNFFDLVDAANEIDVLSAPIDIDTLAHVSDDGQKPKHIAKDVVDRIRKFRNLIHPAAALRQGYDPRAFTKEDLAEFKEIYESVTHSLLYYI
jgi:hypothetical protein